MNDSSRPPLVYKPVHKVRFVTAASLFDGHDASINIMRRILQATRLRGDPPRPQPVGRGDRQLRDPGRRARHRDLVVPGRPRRVLQVHAGPPAPARRAAHQGVRRRRRRHRAGGNPELHDYGVARIFSPEDGQKLGLQGMINEIVAACDVDLAHDLPPDATALVTGSHHARTRALARMITGLEAGTVPAKTRDILLAAAAKAKTPTLGVTGTGGAGKSSLTDEIVRRFRLDQQDRLRIAIVSIDPSRRKTGGALLGDRIRMNAIEHPNIYMRSLATREAGSEVSAALPDVIAACKVAGFDLVDRRDVRDRPGRRRDRAAGRRLALRDDARVRRGVAAREDRHAGLRRLRRDQQVRPAGRAGRAARRAQAGAAQPRASSRRRSTRCRCTGRSRRTSTTTA